MTTRTVTKLVNGDIKEIQTIPGAEPLVWINGVLQPPSEKKKIPWTPWFAWRPVKDLRGNWHWLETVYRKVGNTYVDYDDFTWHYYGTIFDVLENE